MPSGSLPRKRQLRNTPPAAWAATKPRVRYSIWRVLDLRGLDGVAATAAGGLKPNRGRPVPSATAAAPAKPSALRRDISNCEVPIGSPLTMTLKVMQRWRVRARCQCRGDGASSNRMVRDPECAFPLKGRLALPKLDGNTRSRFPRFSLRHDSSLPSADELGGILVALAATKRSVQL